jgi:hypothetical protein
MWCVCGVAPLSTGIERSVFESLVTPLTNVPAYVLARSRVLCVRV